MAGEGFSKHASTSLKNNKSFLRKKSLFKKERSFLNLKRDSIKTDLGTIPSKKVSQKELRRIRRETLKDTKHAFRVEWLLFFAVIGIGVLMGIQYFQKNSEIEKIIGTKNDLEYYQKNIEEYNYLISSGDNWMREKNYHNATFQYEKALEIFPKDSIGVYRLISAYDLQCRTEQQNCEKREELLNSLVQD